MGLDGRRRAPARRAQAHPRAKAAAALARRELQPAARVPAGRQGGATSLAPAAGLRLVLTPSLADEGVEQVRGDAVEAQVHVPADQARGATRRARLRAIHPRALPALLGPVPGAARHQDAADHPTRGAGAEAAGAA